jgi:hypothetical protein
MLSSRVPLLVKIILVVGVWMTVHFWPTWATNLLCPICEEARR